MVDYEDDSTWYPPNVPWVSPLECSKISKLHLTSRTLFAGVHCSLAGYPQAGNVVENQLALLFCEMQSSVVDGERTVVLAAEAIVRGKSGEDVAQEILCGCLSRFNNSQNSPLCSMEVC